MPSPELYFETIFSYQRPAALKSAIELGVFDAIDSGAHTAAEIAKVCAAPERAIRILCDFLTTLGFFIKSGKQYALTPDSALFLSKRSPAYLGGTSAFLFAPKLTAHMNCLTETIRNGVGDASMIGEENPAWVDFARAMVPMMMPAAQAIADLLGVASAGAMRVLDVAAGHGMFGIVIAQRNPNAEVVAVDWAPVLQVATENAEAMGVRPRYRTLPGDAFKVEYGTGFDVVLLTNFLHHFDRRTNVALLKKVAGALKPAGRVVVLEFVPNDDRVTPPMAARFSLVMLASTPLGDAYTFAELSDMLAEAGFTGATAHPLQGPQTVLIAKR
jgi:2-polyprenyl-3-methyl-5-hydroxy-6-metoxy-1,4-benzoquinol methylase